MVITGSASIGILVLAVLSWIVLLSAVAAAHAMFSDIIKNSNDPKGLEDWIADYMGITWWMLWFYFALLVFIGVAKATGRLKHFAQVILTLLASVLALLMLETHQAGILFRVGRAGSQKVRSRTAALLAGAIMSSASVLLLIIWIGTLSGSDTDSAAQKVKEAQKAQEYASNGTNPTFRSGAQEYVAGTGGGTGTIIDGRDQAVIDIASESTATAV